MTEIRRIAALTSAHGVRLAPHAWGSGVLRSPGRTYWGWNVRVARRVGEAARTAESDILDASVEAFEEANGADGVLIVCGGLRTLDISPAIEAHCGVPVVSSTPAAFWQAMRLVGETGSLSGFGRLFETVH